MSIYSQITIIIPTYYPGKIINKCLDSLPAESEILIIDNGDDVELEEIIKLSNLNIKHFKLGDVGLSKSFNYGVYKSKNEKILITQPDVYFEQDTIKNLINTLKFYPKAGIVTPLIYENGIYSKNDFLDLSLNKFGKLVDKKRSKNKYIVPSGDFCVEAVNATAMLFKKSFIKSINGWDENIYTYHEDIDLCVKARKQRYQIIKSSKAIVHHIGFGSHKKENKEKAEKMRNWHYCWSSLYFKNKYSSKNKFIFFYCEKLTKYFFKIIINFLLFRKKKLISNFMRFRACLNYLIIKKATYRVKI
jgi:GT2 family glycosyltransferase